MLPILILYLFLQRYIVEGVTSGAVKLIERYRIRNHN